MLQAPILAKANIMQCYSVPMYRPAYVEQFNVIHDMPTTARCAGIEYSIDVSDIITILAACTWSSY